MAKQWNPTKKQMSVYEDLLKRYNRMRTKIIKAHKNLEKVTPSGRMPSLVVPERQRKMSVKQIRLTGRRLFALKLRQLKKVVGAGLDGFYKTFKDSYLELYRTLIGEDPEYNPFGGGKGFLYSEEQIKLTSVNDKELARFMEIYNNAVHLSPKVFAFLIKTGKIPTFQKLYDELGRGLTYPQSFLSQTDTAVRKWGYFLNKRKGQKMVNDFLEGKDRTEMYMRFVEEDAPKIAQTIKERYR